jgi:hypothetical protein
MPVSVRIDPFNKPAAKPNDFLRTPQARILSALMPNNESDPVFYWPLITRAQLGVKAGYTAISGTVTRALNGIREGSSSGDPYPGVLTRGLVEEVKLDIEGTIEINYRITPAGIKAYQLHIANHGSDLPPCRDKASCVNTDRGYKNPHKPKP